MEFRVLALGDVTSEDGTRHLARTLRPFQKVHGVDFTVVNGENVSGVGLTPDQAEDLFAAGADVITLGNHTWGKMHPKKLPRKIYYKSKYSLTSLA